MTTQLLPTVCKGCFGSGTTNPDGTAWDRRRRRDDRDEDMPVKPADAIRCRACLGRGAVWSDGRPFTRCPRNADPLDGRTGKPDLACGRSQPTCSGCGRAAAEIGLDEDVKREVDALNAAP